MAKVTFKDGKVVFKKSGTFRDLNVAFDLDCCCGSKFGCATCAPGIQGGARGTDAPEHLLVTFTGINNNPDPPDYAVDFGECDCGFLNEPNSFIVSRRVRYEGFGWGDAKETKGEQFQEPIQSEQFQESVSAGLDWWDLSPKEPCHWWLSFSYDDPADYDCDVLSISVRVTGRDAPGWDGRRWGIQDWDPVTDPLFLEVTLAVRNMAHETWGEMGPSILLWRGELGMYPYDCESFSAREVPLIHGGIGLAKCLVPGWNQGQENTTSNCYVTSL